MKALIPVAGYGTRMRPHTLTHPKVLLPVADKPMIAHIVEKLIDDGIDELVFVVGYLGNLVEKFIKESYQVKSSFIEQKEFLGLGHAIFTAQNYLNDDPIFIVLGDTIYDVDLKKVIEKKENALGVKKVDDPRRFGVAILDENGDVSKLKEKPQEFVSDLALVGLYHFENGNKLIDALGQIIKKNIKTKDEFQLTDALQHMIDHEEKFTTFTVEGWHDCGKPETLLRTSGTLINRKYGSKEYHYENTVIIHPVYIHEDAQIRNSIIGPNVTIWPGTVIEEAIIKNSIINSRCEIKRANLRESIVGEHVVIEGTSKSYNLGDYSHLDI